MAWIEEQMITWRRIEVAHKHRMEVSTNLTVVPNVRNKKSVNYLKRYGNNHKL